MGGGGADGQEGLGGDAGRPALFPAPFSTVPCAGRREEKPSDPSESNPFLSCGIAFHMVEIR
jgi:hypothetical protein